MHGAYGRVGALGGWGDANTQNMSAAGANQQADTGGGGGGGWAWLGKALETGVQIATSIGKGGGGGGEVLTTPTGTPTRGSALGPRTLTRRSGGSTASPEITTTTATAGSWLPWLLVAGLVVGGIVYTRR